MIRRSNKKGKAKRGIVRKGPVAKAVQAAKEKALTVIDGSKPKTTSSYSKSSYVPCYESHVALDIGGHKVYGGSCSSPIVTDADVYVGLDSHSFRYQTMPKYPWEPQAKQKAVEFAFAIRDMNAPDNAEDFKKLIDWLAKQIVAGKKVHIGCIGGHGRTGTVLAALVAKMTSEEDAIGYVRKHYCKKAVETSSQIKFLKTHFGVKEVEGSKESYGGYGFSGYGSQQKGLYDEYDMWDSKTHGTPKKKDRTGALPSPQIVLTRPLDRPKRGVTPAASEKAIWYGAGGAFVNRKKPGKV